MIHLILGRQGSGKTLMLVKLALDLHKQGMKIRSNVHFGFTYKPLNYKDIIDCNLINCGVMIDEIHLLLSARRSLSNINVEVCDKFLSMARKQGTEIYGTTQTMRKVDIRFREEADYIYYCSKYAYYNGNWIEILHNYNLPKEVPLMIKADVHEVYSGNVVTTGFVANKYFDFYDTTQIIRIEGLAEYLKSKKKKK